jgi:hypothetical protein
VVTDYNTTWDLLLPHAEFAYNCSVNRSTGLSPFEIVTGAKPKVPIDLSPLNTFSRVCEGTEDFIKHMQDIHVEVRKRIALSSEKYKQRVDLHRRSVELQPGDSVLIRLRPERFPKGSFQKLHHRRAGPFKILQRLGPNAYHIELPIEFHLSPVFNVADLTAFSGNIEEPTTNNLSPNIPIAAKQRDEIEDILDDQLVSTRRGGYQKFLVKWKTALSRIVVGYRLKKFSD